MINNNLRYEARFRDIEARLHALDGKEHGEGLTLLKIKEGMEAYWKSLVQDIQPYVPLREGMRDGDIVEFVKWSGDDFYQVRSRVFPYPTGTIPERFLERLDAR